MSFIFFFFLFIFNGASGITTITVVNNCGFTVWPGISSEYPYLNTTGFELIKGGSRSLQALGGYWSGRVWGRTGCSFNGSGHGSCRTGDCGSGQLECNGGSPTPPVTLADFYVSGEYDDYYDSYYVSLMDGYNLQMTVEATGGSGDELYDCRKAGCDNDLNERCPEELRLKGGGGCQTPCQLYPSVPEYCCNGTSTACNPTTAYTQLFKSACPRSLTNINDDQTGMFYCNGANYTVRFCPPADTFATIQLDSQLNSQDQLVSSHENFTLGFFDGNGGSYLGIWYTNDGNYRKIWIANPNNPFISTSGEHALSIDPNTGNLIITTGGKIVMNITNLQLGPNPHVTATLEDTGNFRLINQIDKRVLWQSFHYPTNILLPGMKLGYDLKTGQNWTLTSRLTNENPFPGAFTLSWEPIDEASERLMIRRRGQPYWTSGNLFKQRFQYMFALNDPQTQNRYKFTYIYGKEERYFSYNEAIHNETNLPMWIFTPQGQITDGVTSNAWTPEFCYGYDSEDGCIWESRLPQCRTKKDKFNKINGVFDPAMTRNHTDENSSLSIGDCFVECWNNCSCVGFSSKTRSGNGCIFWTGSNSFSVSPRQDSTWKYVINNSPSSITGNRRNKKKNQIWILGVAIPVVFLCFGLLWYLKEKTHTREETERRKRDEYFLELTASESFKDVHQIEGEGGDGHNLLLFSFASIMAATSDFSIENKLGQGGFGPVYRGKLSDGREIAIKRLSRSSGQGLVEFKNELILIAKLQHTNLVRILGCCIHGEEKMLIYEYMPNKSLDFFLFDENKRSELDWPKRINIVEGIAQGLLYLHKFSRMRVIHRDLKASNVLLDERMCPKISDFGMARIFNENEAQAMTNRVVGTYGYMSPEYAMEGTFSFKSDIYSFGVLILEIVSGRRNSGFVYLDRTYNLIGYAWELWQEGNALDLEDPALGSTCVVQQFLRIVSVALLCVQESAMHRPTTSDMISLLLNDTISLPTPKKPAFFIGKVESKSTYDEIKSKDCSVNNMSVTVMEGR